MGPKCFPIGLLEHLGLLEASWNSLGGLLERSHLGGQEALEMEAKRVEHRVQEATRAEPVISSKSITFVKGFA